MTTGYRITSRFLAGLLAGALSVLALACSDPATPTGAGPETAARAAPTAIATVTATSRISPTHRAKPATPPPEISRAAAATVPAPTTGNESKLSPEPEAAPAVPQAARVTAAPEAFTQAPPAAVSLAPPPERDLFQLAKELVLPPGSHEISRVVNPHPVSYQAGRKDDFWLVDLDAPELYQATFELRLVTPHAYWYFEEGLNVRQERLERAAAEFEDVIYPRVSAYFGQEWTPGVDNDPHLNIIHGNLRGAAGYFSSTDEYPARINPRSNQREMIYLNSRILPLGSAVYQEVLAHELQHAIHWNHDASEDTWVNEGLAELAVTAAGYNAGSMRRFMRRPTISLVHWPLDFAHITAHYGGASLFMHYLAEHYGGTAGSAGNGGPGDLRPLVTEAADNIAGIDAYLAGAGYAATFHDLFRDWIVANFLDEDRGLYGYADLQVLVQESRLVNKLGELNREVSQYGTDYIELDPKLLEQPLRIRFEGIAENRLLPTDITGITGTPGSGESGVGETGCWWGNAGDSIAASLTRPVDLRGLTEATLTYQVWYSIEKDWDYGYLQVSEDGGYHWDILETPHTSEDNPIGVAFGPGYTGESRGWLVERIDLSRYAGQEIMVRFQHVTDDALNDIGLCLRDLAVPAAGITPGDGGWQPNGFILTDNRVRQNYIVQVIQKGAENRVTAVPLTATTPGVLAGEVVIHPYPGLKRTVVAIAPTAPGTRHKAPYTLELVEAGQ